MQIHDKLFSGVRSYASLRLLTQIASWAGTIYVVRRLGSHALGQYGVALVVYNYLSMTYDGTLVESFVQKPPSSAIERREAFTLAAGAGLLLLGITIALASPVAQLVGDRAVGPLIIGVAIALGLTSFCVVPHASLARDMEFGRLARIGAAQSICVTLSTVLLAWSGAGAWALVAGLIAGAAVRAMLLNAARWGLTLPTLRLGAARDRLRFGLLLLADNALWRWYTSLDTFLLGRWAGTTQLGFYSLAQQVADIPLEKVSTVVNDVSLPAYAALQHDRRAAADLLLETIRTHATLGFAVFWGLAAVAPFAIPALFGRAWGFAVFPLVALAIVAPLRLIGSIETPAMTGLGRPGLLLKTKLIIAPCMTVALIVGCRLGGIRGAALAWATVFPVCYGFAFRYILEAAGVPCRRAVAAARGPMAAAALMVAVVLLWSRAATEFASSPWFLLVTSMAWGAVAYVGGLRLIDPCAFRLAEGRFRRLLGLRVRAS